MVRVVFEGPELADFTSAGADDHVKIFVPAAEGPERRDYTPRSFDNKERTLTVDFAIHDAGPVTQWATAASVGDSIEIGGPRGSLVVSWDFDWWLLIGDETAFPAMGRRIEEAPAGTRMISIGFVAGAASEQSFKTKSDLTSHWVHSARADDPAPLLAMLERLSWPSGDGYVWVAAEAGIARAVRNHIVEQRHHPLTWMRCSGYLSKGQSDAHETL